MSRVDLPVSALVAHLVRGVEQGNGSSTVAALAKDIADELGVAVERIAKSLADAARLLLADGVFVSQGTP